MARTVTSTLRNAIDKDGSYSMLVKADVYPSRIYFEELTSDFAIASADALGIVDNPMRQDIEYSVTDDALVTFFCDGVLKYAIEGSSTITTTMYNSSVRPGVIGSKIYLYNGVQLRRYSINWTSIHNRSTNPIAQDVSISPAQVICAVHGISDTEAVALAADQGGFSALYLSGTDLYESPIRFMFPKMIDWDGSARTLIEMALFSGGLKIDNKIFVYITNAATGMVEGIYYDLDTDLWSDIFIAVPTELATSLCAFYVSNAYTHNGTAYLCGQFDRTDNMDTAQPYSLLLSSPDGKTFCVGRNTLVSNVGYRFLARVGDNRLFLGNCNRVCYDDVTWFFDGASGTGIVTHITQDDIKAFDDKDLNSATLYLRSGKEEYWDHASVKKGAKVIVSLGLKTTAGNEYIVYGTYIIDRVRHMISPGKRGMALRMINLSQWNLSGLSMPFYAELLGKSVIFDPMTEESGEMSAAGSGNYTKSTFQVDFWKQEAYDNAVESITGIDMMDSGGVNYYEASGAHKLGIILKEDIADILQLDGNPVLTEDYVTLNIHGWSHPDVGGNPNDTINVVLVTADADGVETEHISAGSDHWKITYPSAVAGTDPVVIDVINLTEGHTIKRVGVIFECVNTTWFNISRIDFVDGAEAYYEYPSGDTPWERMSDGSFKVPRAGRPFIMFSQRPYNAANFSLTAMFENTVTGGITGYATACGLVALAENASNYTLARYNKTNSKAEFVVCRDGTETVLASATPGFTINNTHIIRFDHKGGRFEIFMQNDVTVQLESVLVYEWQSANGFMYTSDVATMKCGIYGNIAAPLVRILGYYAGNSENITNADGMPVDPLFDMADFPTSGMLRINDNVYSYTGKIAHPSPCRGPYQFRQMGTYSAPYGNGSSGLECRDFDWTAAEDSLNGKLAAISSGANFIISGADWTIYTTTGGVVTWHYNRARYYSDNAQIGKLYHTLSNKVWVVGGFSGVTLVSGNSMKHAEGELAMYELEGEMKCFWFMGAGGADDTTITDLIKQICDLSGASAGFPGDYIDAELVLAGESSIVALDYAEGFDLTFEVASPATFQIRTNVVIASEDYEQGGSFVNDTGSKITIDYLGSSQYRYYFYSTPSQTLMYSILVTQNDGLQKFRIMYHGNNVSVYQNGQWITTIAYNLLEYTNVLDLKAYGTLTLSDIRVRELGDWREAIYIDLETDGTSAIGSVVQQRPVEVVAQPDGSLDFSYNKTRTEITAVVTPRSHEYDLMVPTDGASDAIVYGAVEVKTLQNANFARELGFSTKLMRMPDLNIGAIQATNIILKRMVENIVSHQIVTRPDLQLEVGDVYVLSYTASGTGRVEEHDIIAESIGIDFKMVGTKVSSRMTISGREVYDEPT